jgi:hypothetical protein
MKRNLIYSFLIILVHICSTSQAQIIQGKDTLYGNEWIHYDQSYFKFYISRDGLYRISFEDLSQAGIPVSTLKGSQLQVWRNGNEIPLLIDNPNQWTSSDKLFFWGVKNRSELDALLFTNPSKEMLNPEYSLVSDTSAYYFTWVPAGNSVKRISLIPSNTAQGVSPFYMVDQLYEFHSYPIDKKYDFQNEISLSSYDECEGFGTAFLNNYALTIKPEDAYSGNQDGYITIRLASGNNVHHLVISVNDLVVRRDTFTGYLLKEYKIPLANAILVKDIRLKIECKGPVNDVVSISNIHAVYPKSSGFPLSANESILNTDVSLTCKIGDLKQTSILAPSDGATWYTSSQMNGEYTLQLPSKTLSTKSFVVDLSQPGQGLKLKPSVFSSIADDKKTTYLIITHNRLAQAADEYAAYRRSVAGGGFNVRIVDIDQIYEQFGYGSIRNVIGLRNYGQYIYKNWPTLQYVFMIGRSINYRDLRFEDNVSTYADLFMIPTFGYPGSDNLIFSQANTSVPVFNSARLAANTPEQVRIYLNKVKEYESKLKTPTSNDDLYWRKKILHLAGGDPVADGFDQILNGFQYILEPTDFKANVTLVKKSSSDPVQGGVSEIVKNIINEGVAIHTYLGHGAISATEIGLDDPEIFNNTGKYPVCFTMGCNSGNMHTTGISLSESFIFSRKGDIAYLAASGIGTDGGYREYGNVMYNLLGTTYYDKSISQLHFKSLQAFESSRDPFSVSLNQQFTLHGDPAIQINYFNTPDLTLDSKTFKTVPQNVLADQDSIRFEFTLWNLGRNTKDVIEYEVSHRLPDGTIKTYSFTEQLSLPFKNVHVSIPMPQNAIGNNVINIKIDPANKINELPQPFAENNNELKQNGTIGIVVPIFNTEARPVYPKDFGIVGDGNVELQAATSDAFGAQTNYYFELDTTALFNSAFLKKAVVFQRGGLIRWKPGINQEPNKVYYWRIATDTAVTHTPFIWNQSSFVYLPGQGPGWNQSHAYQYGMNPSGQTLNYDLSSFQWKLNSKPASLVASSINSQLDPAEYSKVLIDGARYTRNNGNYQSEFILTIWDSKVGLVRNPVGGRDGAANVFSVPAPGYYFGMDKNNIEERKNLIRFLETGIQEGQYVIVINHLAPGATYYPENWAMDSVSLGKNLFQVFEANGAKMVRNLVTKYPSYPYLFIFQKGKKVIDEAIATNGLEVRSSFDLPLFLPDGMHESLLIGPSSSWEKLEWATQDNRNSTIDSVVISGKKGNEFDILYSGPANTINLNSIDAKQYPYIKLKWSAKDTLRSGSVNLAYWRIYYKSYGDLAISSNDDFEFYKDTIDQGDNMRLRYTIQNIGDKTIDSARVVYTIIDEQNRSRQDTVSFLSLVPGGKKVLTKEVSTESRVKTQSLLLNIFALSGNPEYSIKNNAGKLNYYVVSDIVPPTVTVLFDGKQILNNDIVPRQPRVHIDLKDNKMLSTTDTSQVVLSIKYPGNDKYLVIPPKDYVITYNKNQASIDYLPRFTLDGMYTLRVQGKDKSGNTAGTAGANVNEVNFKIFTENSVSTILPYPNPFSSQCKFAYTLTGERPMIFKIQIMTVSGRVVRELTENDLGPLEEGTHLTDRSWDGTDEYGNKLATGTYLYRVVMKDNAGKLYSSYETLEDKDAKADKDARRFFTKGIGKLVILR